MITKLKRKFFKRKEPEMVSYWKTKNAVEAKVTRAKEGHLMMYMEGEKYPFPGFPRGVVLYKVLSKLKHEIKNQFFNDAWWLLENQIEEKNVIADRKLLGPVMTNILALTDERRFHMVPPERMVPPVKEIWRALTKVEEKITDPERKRRFQTLKLCLTFILQEDDAYRFRFQWTAKFFPAYWHLLPRFLRRNSLKFFDKGLELLEHAEVVGDMKERMRLLRRILNMMLTDEAVFRLFDEFARELNWKKLRLSKADKYFFRAKWFKCDYPEEEY